MPAPQTRNAQDFLYQIHEDESESQDLRDFALSLAQKVNASAMFSEDQRGFFVDEIRNLMKEAKSRIDTLNIAAWINSCHP